MTPILTQLLEEVKRIQLKEQQSCESKTIDAYAITRDGRLYCSLTQVNTDHRVFCLFMTKLTAELTKEVKEWRKNTIILIDGAKYQTCAEY